MFPPSGGVAVVESGSTVMLLASGGYTTIEGCDPVHYEWQDSQGNVIADGTEITVIGDIGSRVFYTAVTIDACDNRSISADYVWTIAPPAVTVEPPTDPDGTVTTTVTIEDVEGTEVTITPTGGTTSSPDCEPITYEFTAPDGTVTTGASLTVTAPDAGDTDAYSVRTVDACGNKSPAVIYNVVGLDVVVTAPTNASTVEALEGDLVVITPIGGTTSSSVCEPITYEFTDQDGVVTSGASITVTAPTAGDTIIYSVVTVDACGNQSDPENFGVTGTAFDCCGAIEDAIAALPNGTLTIGADGFATTT